MTTRRVGSFLSTLSGMPSHKGLFVSANQIIEIQHVFLRIISPQLAKRCVIGKFSDGMLIIYADSSAIAAKLRQITPSLLDKLGSQVVSIQIVVNARCRKNSMNISSKQYPQLSQSAAQDLHQLALVIPASPLRTAIESLLNNCKPSPNFS